MNLNRNSGLAFGFGIGIVIAIVIFGTSWLAKNFSGALKTQAVLPAVPANTTTPVPVQQVNTPAPQTTTSQDNLVNRLVPNQQDVANDIQNNLQQLYGPKTTP